MREPQVWINLSGGIASAVACLFALEDSPDAIIRFADTGAEHCDTLRFVREFVAHYGLEKQFELRKHPRHDLWSICRHYGRLPSTGQRFCSSDLKRDQIQRGTKKGDSVVVGFDGSEVRRIIRLSSMLAAKRGQRLLVPLADRHMNRTDVHKWFDDNVPVKRSAMYQWATHANCVTCFIAGKRHWVNVRKHEPGWFQKAVDLEKELDRWIFEDGPLEKVCPMNANAALFPVEVVPCDCAVS